MSTALLAGLFDVGDCVYKSNSSRGLGMGILDKRPQPASAAPAGNFIFSDRRHRSPKFQEFCFKAEPTLQQHNQQQQQHNQQQQQHNQQQQQHNQQQQQQQPHIFPKEGKFRDRSYSEGGERPALHRVASAGSATVPCGGLGGLGAQSSSSSRYKTELCRPFEESGACKYGDKCQFAHGHHELRTLVRHPKYKTELCRTFHTIGFCPYGPRCHFIHNAEEKRSAHGGRGGGGGGDHRPRLQHSLSFSGFSTPAMLGLDSPPRLHSPLSLTPPPPPPPPGLYAEIDAALLAPVGSAAAAAAAASSSSSSSASSSASSSTPPPSSSSSSGYSAGGYANNAFTFSHQELANMFAPFAIPRPIQQQQHQQQQLLQHQLQQNHQQNHQQPAPVGGASPPSCPAGCEQRRPAGSAPSPVSEPPPSPQGSSFSDHDSCSSSMSSSGSLSGSESPVMDPNRRLPIFSRLSITDD